MAEAAIYLACAPKSNACTVAWKKARAAVREHGSLPVPMHLRNAPTKLMKDMGYGAGYRYAHDEEHGYARGETYLPESLAGHRYYAPSERGLEGRIAAWMQRLRSSDADAESQSSDADSESRSSDADAESQSSDADSESRSSDADAESQSSDADADSA
jgi:putative ATPase